MLNVNPKIIPDATTGKTYLEFEATPAEDTIPAVRKRIELQPNLQNLSSNKRTPS